MCKWMGNSLLYVQSLIQRDEWQTDTQQAKRQKADQSACFLHAHSLGCLLVASGKLLVSDGTAEA
jgi:predicted alpha/beta hydrolase family esterase